MRQEQTVMAKGFSLVIIWHGFNFGFINGVCRKRVE